MTLPLTAAPASVSDRRGRYVYALSVLHHRPSVSSDELARLAGTGPSQVRRDLSSIGRLGKRGVGYRTDTLLDALALADPDVHRGVLVSGDGPTAQALRDYEIGLLAYVGVEQTLTEADVVAPDWPHDPDRGRTIAREQAQLGVPTIVQFCDYKVDAPPARVVYASPLAALVEALAEDPR